MFLWLGNYTHAAVTCQDWSTKCDTLDLCDCTQPDLPDSDAWLCNTCKTLPTADATAKQNCLDDIVNGPGIWISNGQWWMACCDKTCQTCKAQAWSITKYDSFSQKMTCYTTGAWWDQAFGNIMVWAPCNSPKWWIRNWNDCSCPDWTKKIDNVCEPCNKKWVCCGVELNTSVPFIGKCIEDTTGSVSPDETWVTWDQAFPVLMWSLTKILVTVILILSFVLIVIGGIMIATGDPSGGKKMIIRVVIGIALLGASGVILRLINPNFFG